MAKKRQPKNRPPSRSPGKTPPVGKSRAQVRQNEGKEPKLTSLQKRNARKK